jgi:ubiquinone/menaquinone biosynthesis C-methylase UbiE
MFSEAPELYDLIYGSFKDYRSEADKIAEVLSTAAPEAKTVLDVACGTGEHARHLHAEHGYVVAGLDIEPGFVAIARSKLPNRRFWHADMAGFDLGVRFDAILCLFSSIAYLCELDQVEQALRCCHRHLEPDGVLLVEPWFEPHSWAPGRVYVQTSESENLRVIRMSHSKVAGRISKLEFHYLIGTAEGIDHRVERHELGLFTTAETLERFRRAGFTDVTHDPEGLTGRGMFVARVDRAESHKP